MTFKVYGYTLFFCHFTKGNNFCDFLFDSMITNPSKMGSTVKEKNLLLEEQFFSFKSTPYFKCVFSLRPFEKGGKLKMTELLPLKVY